MNMYIQNTQEGCACSYEFAKEVMYFRPYKERLTLPHKFGDFIIVFILHARVESYF